MIKSTLPLNTPRALSLTFPVTFPQTMVLMANIHMLPSVGTSVQVTVVWLVVLGQLPQFDARMLEWIAGQSGATGLQVKVMCLKLRSINIREGLCGGAYGAVNNCIVH